MLVIPDIETLLATRQAHESLPPRPYSRSYWVVPGRVLAGFIPSDRDAAAMHQKLTGLLECGVSAFVNLMEEFEVGWNGEPLALYQPTLYDMLIEQGGTNAVPITYTRIPIVDRNTPTQATMRLILNTIDDAWLHERCAYIHCWGGKGRTGTVVGCWLVRHGMQPEQALRAVQELRIFAPDERAWQPAPETPEQCEFVLGWKQGE